MNMRIAPTSALADDLRFIPTELRLLWDESFSSTKTGGLTSLRGLYYQYLYSIRLAKELLRSNPLYQGYASEWIEDFLAWGQNDDGSLKRVLLVQVKTALNKCFLASGDTNSVFTTFQKGLDALLPYLTPQTEIKCRLVYNPHIGHDCETSGCIRRIHKRHSYRSLAKNLEAAVSADGAAIEFVRFLPIPIGKRAILAELDFLNDRQSGIVQLLETEKDFVTFVRAIYGLISPFYVPRQSLAGNDPRDDLILGQLHRNKIHTVEDFETALSIVANIRRRSFTDKHRRIHDFAKRQARKEFEAAPVPRKEIPKIRARGISFKDAQSAKNALAIIHTLAGERQSLLFNVDQFALFRESDSLRLETFTSEVVPICENLRKPQSTHRERIKLILSFIQSVISWAAKGVLLLDFRADLRQYQDFYLAGANSQFVLGDLEVLALSSDSRRLLDEFWLPGPVLSKALRYLYYGKVRRKEIENTRLSRATWNDNIVRDLSNWLDSLPFVDVRDVQQTLESVFSDELSASPLIFSDIVEDQFIYDAIDAGHKSTADVLAESRPSYLSKDRGHWGYPLLYFSWSDGQVGGFEEATNLLKLYRYKEYHTRRWRSARDRDFARAWALRPIGDRETIAAVRCREDLVGDVCAKVFGISRDQYVDWFQRQKDEAEHIRKDLFPPVMKRENNLFLYRQEKQDALSNKRFAFRVIDTDLENGSGSVIALQISNGRDLLQHLNELGYRPKTVDSLSVICADNAGMRVTSSLFQLDTNDGEVILKVLPPPRAELLPQQGYLQLKDVGKANVLKDEGAILREYELYLASRETVGRDIPAGRAWEWLEPLFGRERPQRRSNKTINGVRQDFKTNDEIVNGLVESIRSEQSSDYWHVITGAAGTGKTHVTVSVTLRYLEATRSQEFPPRRVLVVSAAHFGVDNFVRVFLKTCDNRYVPYRYITESRLRASQGTDVIDRALYEFCKAHYDAMTPELPHPIQRSPRGPSFLTYHSNLEAHLRNVNRRRISRKASMFIPSHERWRVTFAEPKRWFPFDELDATRRYLTTKAKYLKLYQEQLQTENSKPVRLSSNVYPKFAAEVVATTVDAFDRFPDMHFDLIVIEEASQLGVLKLLKLLTKVARARDAKLPPPKIILSGDERQLPPFLEQIQPDGGYTGADRAILKKLFPEARKDAQEYQEYETAFETISRRHADRVVPLMTQYRMQAQIASVVNRLFYEDQSWLKSRKDAGSGVVWIDTCGLNAKFEKSGTSKFNEIEIRLVVDLAKNLASQLHSDPEEILIVSPYFAQVDKLKLAVRARIPGVKVRTIDGCQGIEAANVIVSFVTLSFAPGKDFVVNPKRMNVAISRARDSLYLVGDFTEAATSARTSADTGRYDHMTELVKLFAADGLWRFKRTPGRYHR
jgi:hypothetical protein